MEVLDPAWQEWRDYCPNATTLSALGALQMCPDAQQQAKAEERGTSLSTSMPRQLS